MASGYNKVTLFGNLGAEPELRKAGDTSVLSLRIACNERYKDKSGEWVDKAEWVNCSVWGKRADGLARILSKGDRVLIDGSLRTRSFEKDGQKHYRTEVSVRELVLGGGGNKGGHDQRSQATLPSTPRDAADPFAGNADPFADDAGQDIPF